MDPAATRGARWLELIAPVPESRMLAARIFGAMWATGSLSSWLTLAFPVVPDSYRPAVLLAAVVTGIVAVLCWWLSRRPAGLLLVAPLSLLVGLCFGGVIIAMTGGPQSAGRVTLVFCVVFAAWCFRLRVALAWSAVTLVAYSAPLLYSEGVLRQRFLAELLVIVPSYLALAGGVIAAKRQLVIQRQRAERLAGEQGALRRVATTVAEGAEPAAVHAVVAEETARLLDAGAAVVLRSEGGSVTAVVGSWPPAPDGGDPGPALLELPLFGAARRALGCARPLVAPVRVDGSDWGALAVACDDDLAGDADRRLRDVGDLLGLAIANLEARARLAMQANTDPLTGLANRRAFFARLEAEVERARRHGGPLSLAAIDCDDLKRVNDEGGHAAGDALLRALAEALGDVARVGDTVARTGGDEFAWLLPDTDRAAALAAVERVRELLGERATERPLGISVGISDLTLAAGSGALTQQADAALYLAKRDGRGVTFTFDPSLVPEWRDAGRDDEVGPAALLPG